ncbi:MAG: hypothetical protein SNJ82_11480 [Gemmataceae bacterium]
MAVVDQLVEFLVARRRLGDPFVEVGDQRRGRGIRAPAHGHAADLRVVPPEFAFQPHPLVHHLGDLGVVLGVGLADHLGLQRGVGDDGADLIDHHPFRLARRQRRRRTRLASFLDGRRLSRVIGAVVTTSATGRGSISASA